VSADRLGPRGVGSTPEGMAVTKAASGRNPLFEPHPSMRPHRQGPFGNGARQAGQAGIAMAHIAMKGVDGVTLAPCDPRGVAGKLRRPSQVVEVERSAGNTN
jgi:hypothetical protein